MMSPTDLEAPLLTVLMPLRAYHPPFLAKALDSLRAQSSARWRLLIVDDGAAPTDILDDALSDPRVDRVGNEGRMLAGALNTGMRRARTAFVASLFADDMWSTDAVQVLTECIAGHPEVDFFHSARVFIDEHDNPISAIYGSSETFGLQDFVEGSSVRHLLCWRREMGLAVGGVDESIVTGARRLRLPLVHGRARRYVQGDPGCALRDQGSPRVRAAHHARPAERPQARPATDHDEARRRAGADRTFHR